jgi:acyl carrier protein
VTESEILERCSRILRDLLADDSIVLAMSTTRDQVPNWDSFGYVNFIVMVEMAFGIKFRVAEVESFPDVGAIVHSIMAKVPAR